MRRAVEGIDLQGPVKCFQGVGTAAEPVQGKAAHGVNSGVLEARTLRAAAGIQGAGVVSAADEGDRAVHAQARSVSLPAGGARSRMRRAAAFFFHVSHCQGHAISTGGA